MTDKRIVYTQPGGAVAVVIPTPEYIAKLMGQSMTEDEAVDAVKAKDVPAGSINVIVTEATSLPTDRTFRDAWTRTGQGLPKVDMARAQAIHSGRMAGALAGEVARLKLSEQAATLAGRAADAASDNATRTALEALNLATLATQIGNAGNETALKAVWPGNVPKP